MDLNELIKYIPEIKKQEDLDIKKCKEIIDSLEKHFYTIKEQISRPTFSKFLYFNCHVLNRFSIPSQYYVNTDDHEYFSRFLQLFEKIENGFLDNILTLKIDNLTWLLLNDIEIKEYDNIPKYFKQLNEINNNISSLSEKKRIEYIEHYEKFLNLINGFKNHSIYTLINCHIPVTPVEKVTTINTKYKNCPITIKLYPDFLNNKFISTNENSFITQKSNSNWQFSTCSIEIIITGYIDLLVGEKKLYYESSDIDYTSTSVFTFLYNLISNISWQIRWKNKDKTLSNWLLYPSDIENVTYELKSNNETIKWVNYPVSKTLHISSIDINEDVIDLMLENEILWYKRCLILAINYLSCGESHLSIFWLNIGIEAFFEYKISEICNNLQLDKNNIFFENYFDRTKRELKKINKNELFDKIVWPTDSPIHLSVFKKLNILFQKKILDPDLKKNVLSHYNNISKYRNDIFHGSSNERIDIEFVNSAINSYKWLLENINRNEFK